MKDRDHALKAQNSVTICFNLSSPDTFSFLPGHVFSSRLEFTDLPFSNYPLDFPYFPHQLTDPPIYTSVPTSLSSAVTWPSLPTSSPAPQFPHQSSITYVYLGPEIWISCLFWTLLDVFGSWIFCLPLVWYVCLLGMSSWFWPLPASWLHKSMYLHFLSLHHWTASALPRMSTYGSFPL